MQEMAKPLDYSKEYYLSARLGMGVEPTDIMRAKRVAELGEPSEVGPILEVGCGLGHVVKVLRDMGYDAYGIDFSPAAIDNRVSEFAQLGDASQIPFGDRFFGAVATFHAMEHMDPPLIERVLREIDRVCQKRLMVVIPGLVPEATVEPQRDHVYMTTFDGWYTTLRSGLTGWEFSKAEIYEPEYYRLKYHELWFWMNRSATD